MFICRYAPFQRTFRDYDGGDRPDDAMCCRAVSGPNPLLSLMYFGFSLPYRLTTLHIDVTRTDFSGLQGVARSGFPFHDF